jgi:hypothetical protein
MAPIDLALEELRSLKPGEKVNITKIAEKYGVNRSTLSRRFNGVTRSKQAHYNNQQFLNDEQSNTLVKWVNRLTERGLPPTRQTLANLAKDITGVEPGKNWPGRWLKKHSHELIYRFSSGLDIDRQRADSASKYEKYFANLRAKIEKYDLQPDQIYNMDEKGFMIGVSKKRKRIFSRSAYEQGKQRQHLQDGNREWITTIGCICANGTALSPGLIYMAKSGLIQSSWVEDFDPKEHACFFASSETGWTNNELGLEWLKSIFDRETKHKASRGWRLLILDGHGSHINMKFLDYCDQNRILLAQFPAHATHTLQPLDVALFGPLSHHYDVALDQFLYESEGFTRLRKRDFFSLFWIAWGKAFTERNIKSGFKSTGLSPFDPDIVIRKFIKKPNSRPQSSKSTTSIFDAKEWRPMRAAMEEIIDDTYNKKAKKIKNTMYALSTQVILLQNRCEGLERTLINIQKRNIKKKPLLLDMPSENDGGAIFWSPQKIQNARDLLHQKYEEAAQEQARKDDKKLQQRLAKEAKEKERVEKAQIRQQQREQRHQEAVEKEHLKAELKLAKAAILQLQKDIQATRKPRRKRTHQKSQQSPTKSSPTPHKEVVEEVIPTNSRGRPIRLPVRFR